ncbi:sigma-70 family RNA polymerase sigma factor [Caproiciproducens galactitolivorans]|uniref:RNA polymerase sigma factor SigV n=1 Tax=Caproiciproducens galactitolivorans TaxID=642589 RepID=A0A4Z0Y3M5_9FIRM|nr:sigma-70 family RNA polymerase sigma factor [Caproiciproducens galactitolivorans]QEY35715.1 sigma-70 family RNA polymerase sigma factor [Caproiciproducens galactitolivorans]TGJ77447.1 RNA polymerase sigma factor SigV [Caproiciproducens galactitolivorans]
MEKTSSGTNDVVTEALDKYSDMVRRICFMYLKSEADVEDIFQNVFLKLLQHKEPFESDAHEKAWLCRVTINECKDFHKSFFRKNTCSIDNLEIPIEDKAEEGVLREVLSLPQKYRNVIYLFYFEDYTVPEIATILGRNQNTIHTHLRRAKAILKKKLRGFDDGNYF